MAITPPVPVAAFQGLPVTGAVTVTLLYVGTNINCKPAFNVSVLVTVFNGSNAVIGIDDPGNSLRACF